MLFLQLREATCNPCLPRHTISEILCSGSGVGQGIASGRCIDGISRQPEAGITCQPLASSEGELTWSLRIGLKVADDLRGVLLLSLAFMEPVNPDCSLWAHP